MTDRKLAKPSVSVEKTGTKFSMAEAPTGSELRPNNGVMWE
jgi:hypothetical protein